jgi:hypothetical protein
VNRATFRMAHHQLQRPPLPRRMLEILDHATHYPKPDTWHNIGFDEAGKEAVARLRAKGLVEMAEYASQYRLTR